MQARTATHSYKLFRNKKDDFTHRCVVNITKLLLCFIIFVESFGTFFVSSVWSFVRFDFAILLIFSFLSIYSLLANKLKQFAEAKSGTRIKSGDIGNGNNNDAASMHSKTVNATAAFNLLQFVLNVENFLSITIIKCMSVWHI